MAYEFGKIWKLISIFDPVVVEDSGFISNDAKLINSDDDDEIFL